MGTISAPTRAYRRIRTESVDELVAAVPGGRFWLSPVGQGRFWGGHEYVALDGLVLNRVDLGWACVAVGGERDRNSTVCSVIGPHAAMNGREIGEAELTLVHPGASFTLATGSAATLHSFTLEPEVCAERPELDLPFGFLGDRRPGRWMAPSDSSVREFVVLLQTVFSRLLEDPTIQEASAVRVALRNAFLRTICALADEGAFVADVAAARRHTQVVLRFQRALEELEPECLDILELCRVTETSRRSLEAIVRERTGFSPWDYLRRRRLVLARERLRTPDAATSVTKVASDLGIWHLGRFSREYADAFGESPRATLRKCRGATVS